MLLVARGVFVNRPCLFVEKGSAKQSWLPILQGQVGSGFSFVSSGGKVSERYCEWMPRTIRCQ
jgi:hypothetical protein